MIENIIHKVKIKRFVNSVFNSNTYVIFDDQKGIIIDIGDFDPLFEIINNLKIEIKALFITHTHYDHIYGIREFIREIPYVPIYTSVFGKEALRKSNWNFSRYHDDPIEIDSPAIRALDERDSIKVFDNYEVKVIPTPGHDKSCLTYRIGDALFTGDSYIPGIKVIASFPNSNKTEAKMWYAQLQKMACDYLICPGHGDIVFPKPSSN